MGEFKGTLKGAPKEKSVSLSSKNQVDNRPWKNRRPKGKVLKVNPFDNVEVGMQSKLPKTFKGDLGGSARDFELLAELKAISSNAKRFEEDENIGNKNITNKEMAQKAVKPIASASKQSRMKEPPTSNSALRTDDQKNRNIKNTNHVSFKDSISTCDTEL